MLRVAVIGGGLQGVGIAVELSRRNVLVDLHEKTDALLGQASLRNEGKIHLGFVYGMDRDLATARLMARAALQFEPTLRSWLEVSDVACPTSSPFHYLVHRESLMSPAELASHYDSVTAMVRELSSGPCPPYFGQDPRCPTTRTATNGVFDSEEIQAVFQTPEIAIDPEWIADRLRQRVLDDPRIAIRTGSDIARVERSSDSVTLEIRRPEGNSRKTYDHVVNASWTDLPRLDSTAGVPALGPWSFRVKHFLRARGVGGSVALPSVTIALGPFGDVVTYTNGDVFLSWYPVGRTGISSALRPPDWPLPLGEPEASIVREGTLQALSRIVPSLSAHRGALENTNVLGGVIFALGATDVHDPASRLHQRYDVGPRSFGRYHTVDTGKYTLAPMFAKLAADGILNGNGF